MKKLPPILLPTSKPWSSPGISKRPKGCSLCKYSQIGQGFCYDYFPEVPKIAVMLPYPDSDSIVEQTPLSGGVGKYFLRHFVYNLGYKKSDVAVGHVIRCMPPWKKIDRYPTGTLRYAAESNCRQFDNTSQRSGDRQYTGFVGWNPTMFLLSYDPSDVFKVGAYYRQLQRDMQKAFDFAGRNERPVVLLGKEPMELLAGHLKNKGGLPVWRGHFWYTDGWTFNLDKETRTFKQV